MALSITAALQTPETYHHTFIAAPSDEECFMCGEEFMDNPTQEQCRAIRLSHCGHIVGHHCFQSWIGLTPNACPYWNHSLPSTSQTTDNDEHFGIVVLKWLCLSHPFVLFEALLLELFALDDTAISALMDIQNRRLTAAGAQVLRHAYFKMSCGLALKCGDIAIFYAPVLTTFGYAMAALFIDIAWMRALWCEFMGSVTFMVVVLISTSVFLLLVECLLRYAVHGGLGRIRLAATAVLHDVRLD